MLFFCPKHIARQHKEGLKGGGFAKARKLEGIKDIGVSSSMNVTL